MYAALDGRNEWNAAILSDQARCVNMIRGKGYASNDPHGICGLLHPARLLLRHGQGKKICRIRVQLVNILCAGGEGSQAGSTHQHRQLRRIPHAPQNLLPSVVKSEHMQVGRGEDGIFPCDAQKSMQRKPSNARMRIALGFRGAEQITERAGGAYGLIQPVFQPFADIWQERQISGGKASQVR